MHPGLGMPEAGPPGAQDPGLTTWLPRGTSDRPFPWSGGVCGFVPPGFNDLSPCIPVLSAPGAAAFLWREGCVVAPPLSQDHSIVNSQTRAPP